MVCEKAYFLFYKSERKKEKEKKSPILQSIVFNDHSEWKKKYYESKPYVGQNESKPHTRFKPYIKLIVSNVRKKNIK